MAWMRAFLREDGPRHLARQKLGRLDMSESLRFSFEVLFRELEYLRGLRRELLRQLRRLARSDRYREDVELLKSAPGIGALTAIRLVLEWGDVRRFARKGDFASFLGLVPSDYSSGEKERRGHITKQGNPRLRALVGGVLLGSNSG